MNKNSRDNDYIEFALSQKEEAAEFALSVGGLRFWDNRELSHVQCSLKPYETDADFYQETVQSTSVYNKLYGNLSRNRELLEEYLDEAREADDFVRLLFDCLPDSLPEKPWVFLNRNDCMPYEGRYPKQVEMNLMASALGEMSSRVSRMHRYLYRDTELGSRILTHDVGSHLAEGMVEGLKASGDEGVILFVIPPDEQNIFDQRTLEIRLVENYAAKVYRTTLEDLGRDATIQNGDLYFQGKKVGLVYFRVGYAPSHYVNQYCWDARKLIEKSSAISVPAVTTQLANMKGIQQLLTQSEIIAQHLDREEIAVIEPTFVGFGAPFESISWRGSQGLAKDFAISNPDDWVLKPYREGGANNYFGQSLVDKLSSMTKEESKAFVLMEMIHQPSFDSVSLSHFEAKRVKAVTELGIYGVSVYSDNSAEATVNSSVGYLLRTKPEDTKEGGIIGGYSFLDAVAFPEGAITT